MLLIAAANVIADRAIHIHLCQAVKLIVQCKTATISKNPNAFTNSMSGTESAMLDMNGFPSIADVYFNAYYVVATSIKEAQMNVILSIVVFHRPLSLALDMLRVRSMRMSIPFLLVFRLPYRFSLPSDVAPIG